MFPDTPIEGAAGIQTKNVEEAPGKVVESVAEEDSHAEDGQEEVLVDDSTFNNDSLFAIPAEGLSLSSVMFSNYC